MAVFYSNSGSCGSTVRGGAACLAPPVHGFWISAQTYQAFYPEGVPKHSHYFSQFEAFLVENNRTFHCSRSVGSENVRLILPRRKILRSANWYFTYQWGITHCLDHRMAIASHFVGQIRVHIASTIPRGNGMRLATRNGIDWPEL